MPNSYNHQIDFLRAFAVFLVIFNHLNISLLQGGFIGVDVFLVISGYLITKNIIKEQTETSSFSIKSFYERRIIRLAPSFFTVLGICLIVFGLVLTQSEWKLFLQSVLSSVSLSSNIFFSTQLNDYFSINAYSTPLLHIWSLSLEEQFYLIWPFVLLFIFRTSTKKYLLYFSIFITVSLIFSEFLSQNYPIFAYYLLPSRIFEFCIGAIVAVLPYRKFNQNFSYLITLVSIFIILVASMMISKQTKFPTYNALIPCLAAATFIYFSQNIKSLSFANPIYYLGKISYPMYLWHWPIIVYLSLYSISFTPLICILVILLTIIFSSLTHEVIEKNVKNYSMTSNQNIKLFFILPVCLILAISLLLLNQTKIQLQSDTDYTQSISIKCVDQKEHPIEECFFGIPSKDNIDVLLVGDSHANSLSGFVDVLAKDAGLQGYELTHSSTAFLLNVDRHIYDQNIRTSKQINSFYEFNNFSKELIESNKFKFVIISGYFPENWVRNIYTPHNVSHIQLDNSLQSFRQGFEDSIKLIIQSGATPIIINDTPLLSNIDVNCNLRSSSPKEQCSFDKKLHINHFKVWEHELLKLSEKYKALKVIDLNNMICDSNNCYSYIHSTPLYRDFQHLTYKGSATIGTEFLKVHKNPLKDTANQSIEK